MNKRFRNLSLIKKIVLFQFLTVITACAVYTVVVYPYQTETERQLIEMAALWIAIVVALFVISIMIYTLQIGRPVRRLVQVLQHEAPADELNRITRSVGGEIGHIAGEVKQMLVRVKGAERMRGELEREKEINLIRQRIAHDVRSPLSVIKKYIEKLPRPDDDDDWEEFYESAVRSVAKLENMATVLLDYSRAKQVEREPVFIKSLVSDVVSELKLKANESGVELQFHADDGVRANLDREKLNRVLVNMVANAIQATPESGLVTVRAYRADEGVSFIIEDNGMGIDSRDLPRIFDNYFTSGKNGGTGLGLVYCRQVVEAHGGNIEVKSDLGKGTTFTVRIPSCIVEGDLKTETTDSEEVTVKEPLKRLVDTLIADDNPETIRRARGEGASAAPEETRD